jgi:hypothetical protein
MSKRRIQNYVDREVQFSLIRRLSVHWLLFIAANVVAIVIWTRFMETPTESLDDTMKLAIQRALPFGLISLFLAPIFIWDAVKLSNRFAGPIVRVRRALAQIAKGESPRLLEFRQGDFWKSLAQELNRAFIVKSTPSNSNSQNG